MSTLLAVARRGLSAAEQDRTACARHRDFSAVRRQRGLADPGEKRKISALCNHPGDDRVSARCCEPGRLRSARKRRDSWRGLPGSVSGVLCRGLHGFCARDRAAQRHVFAAWAAACFSPGAFCACRCLRSPAAGRGGARGDIRRQPQGTVAFEFYGHGVSARCRRSIGTAELSCERAGWTPPARRRWTFGSSRSARCCAMCAARPAKGECWSAGAASRLCRAGDWRCGGAAGRGSGTGLTSLPGAHHLAFIRTLTLCAAALGLVSGGARWRRVS